MQQAEVLQFPRIDIKDLMLKDPFKRALSIVLVLCENSLGVALVNINVWLDLGLISQSEHDDLLLFLLGQEDKNG